MQANGVVCLKDSLDFNWCSFFCFKVFAFDIWILFVSLATVFIRLWRYLQSEQVFFPFVVSLSVMAYVCTFLTGSLVWIFAPHMLKWIQSCDSMFCKILNSYFAACICWSWLQSKFNLADEVLLFMYSGHMGNSLVYNWGM